MIRLAKSPPPLSPMARPMVRQLQAQIASGQLAGGQRLPTVRDLAQQHGVSYRIAHQAIAHLEACGLVETLQGSGTYVAERRRPASTRRRTRSHQVFILSNDIPHTYGAMMHPIVTRLQEAGLLATPVDYGVDASRLPELMPIFSRWEKDPPRAIILKGGHRPVIEVIRRMTPPGTCVIRAYGGKLAEINDWHLVTPDEVANYRMAARYLLECGHHRIGLVTTRRPPGSFVEARLQRDGHIVGILRAYADAGLRRGLLVHMNPKTEADPMALGTDPANVRRLVKWLTRPDRPTGLIAATHRAECIKLALGVAGLEVGKHVELVTYGAANPMELNEHPCVVEPHEAIAEQIVRLVLDHGRDNAIKRVVVPAQLRLPPRCLNTQVERNLVAVSP